MALDYDKTEYTLTYNEEKQKYRLKYSQADVFAVVIAKSLVEAPVLDEISFIVSTRSCEISRRIVVL